ncbi:uncharacterized protein N7496_004312 [Penicillium cataractarum]|uniref:Transcription factor domain-containing protein n=1 Tax=Penicillium cataractarum TaxID=2100454 RepID=A0A9W9SQ98_9EURO|nr:uncharacterized protein N7496_004312 [Penicillium cataractarum]KAJ5381884.1 hypothetical protein N7496_004312 [Penicillium cataractarum]
MHDDIHQGESTHLPHLPGTDPIMGGNSGSEQHLVGLDGPSLPTPSSPTGVESPHAFAGNPQSAWRNLGDIFILNGMPVLSQGGRDWIESSTGQEFCLDRVGADVQGWQLSLVTDPTDQGLPCKPDLPDLRVLLEEIHLYRSTDYGVFFPIIDPSLLQSTIDAAYHGKVSAESSGRNSAKACIFAFHALAMTAIPDTEKLSSRPSIDYAREAYRLLPEVFNEKVTLDGLQALLLLVGSCMSS